MKIIEHYSSTDGVGSSRGNRVSAGRELLFATSISHPNVVRLRTHLAARDWGGGFPWCSATLVHAAEKGSVALCMQAITSRVKYVCAAGDNVPHLDAE